jgi:hypothetical protein
VGGLRRELGDPALAGVRVVVDDHHADQLVAVEGER